MSEYTIKLPRKLIEVAIPLEIINAASVRESYIYRGNPSSLHKWFAQRPLAAARAVIFAQLVNDPSGIWEAQNPGQKPSSQQKSAWTRKRKELFTIIERLVKWENTTDMSVLNSAKAEIDKSWKEVCEINQQHPKASTLFNAEKMPILHDPFAGGGTIPLEAQRLGLDAYASDLNPVAVLINKAMIEVPPRFYGQLPVSHMVNSRTNKEQELDIGHNWKAAEGLAEDVRRYGKWIHAEAVRRMGSMYPPAIVTEEIANKRPDLSAKAGDKFPVIAWIWARTVKSPDPAFSHVHVPLTTTFLFSSKAGKEAFARPVINGDAYSFDILTGTPPETAAKGTKAQGKGSDFFCILSGAVISGKYIKDEAKAGRMGTRLMAVVAIGPKGRVYLPPESTDLACAQQSVDNEMAKTPLHGKAGDQVPLYGMNTFAELFTPRQLRSLTTLSALTSEARETIKNDAILGGMADDGVSLKEGGKGATAYAEAVSIYLSFAVSKTAEYSSSLTVWYSKEDRPKGLFARHAISMVWDFPEQNPLSDIGGSFIKSIDIVSDSLSAIISPKEGQVKQANAAHGSLQNPSFISTDPPYYDNISYADLSDFFYTWLRQSLRPIYPDLFTTISVPKSEELVATTYTHQTKEQAESFFLGGMTDAMRHLSENAHPAAPVTIYYAFKQSEIAKKGEVSSTGWVTFISAVLSAGFQLTGTWPIRTERQSRSIGVGANALASSIVLVCRKRPKNAPVTTRREFVREINSLLPEALEEMTKGSGDDSSPVAPVDLSQAIIGPGMSIFSKYSAVLEADGSPMSVKTAMQLINRFLAEDDFDADTQFCLSWFEQNGWREAPFGDADTLARGKGTSVDGVKEAGVIQSGGGKVRLFKWSEYPADWNPLTDNRTPIWEALHHLIRALKRDGGETASGALLAALGGKAEAVRQLAYRLYTLCERLGQAEDARAYNELITSWTGIETAAAAAPKPTDGQLPGFENN